MIQYVLINESKSAFWREDCRYTLLRPRVIIQCVHRDWKERGVPIDQGIVLVIIISRQYRRLLRYIEVSRLTLMVPDVYQMRGSEVWNDCDEILFISVVIICLGNRLDYPVANKILNCCFMKEKRESVSLRWLQDAIAYRSVQVHVKYRMYIYRSMYRRRSIRLLLLTKGKRWFRIKIMRVEICRSNE